MFRYVVFYVVMWTNPSIITVTATSVDNCICRYKTEKAGTLIRVGQGKVGQGRRVIIKLYNVIMM